MSSCSCKNLVLQSVVTAMRLKNIDLLSIIWGASPCCKLGFDDMLNFFGGFTDVKEEGEAVFFEKIAAFVPVRKVELVVEVRDAVLVAMGSLFTNVLGHLMSMLIGKFSDCADSHTVL